MHLPSLLTKWKSWRYSAGRGGGGGGVGGVFLLDCFCSFLICLLSFQLRNVNHLLVTARAYNPTPFLVYQRHAPKPFPVYGTRRLNHFRYTRGSLTRYSIFVLPRSLTTKENCFRSTVLAVLVISVRKSILGSCLQFFNNIVAELDTQAFFRIRIGSGSRGVKKDKNVK